MSGDRQDIVDSALRYILTNKDRFGNGKALLAALKARFPGISPVEASRAINAAGELLEAEVSMKVGRMNRHARRRAAVMRRQN